MTDSDVDRFALRLIRDGQHCKLSDSALSGLVRRGLAVSDFGIFSLTDRGARRLRELEETA